MSANDDDDAPGVEADHDVEDTIAMSTLGIEPSGNPDVDNTRLIYHGTVAPTLEEVKADILSK